jgi:predicted nucleotidyltransferase
MTHYPELDEVLRDHAARLREALGECLIGVYLQGSLAIGDFDLTSDVDFVVVTADALSDSQVGLVQAVHDQTYGQDNRWVKHIEYSFFPKSLLDQPSSPYSPDGRAEDTDRELWYFDNGSDSIERSGHDNSLVVRWTLREKGIAVIGPPATSLLSPVPTDALRTEIRNTLIGWGRELLADPGPYRNRFYQAFLVLNYCRMLQDLDEGRVTSKLDGANWAKAKLDPRWVPLIDFCWSERQDTEIHVSQAAVPAVFDEVLAFVEYSVGIASADAHGVT